jgi:hypothetical protein
MVTPPGEGETAAGDFDRFGKMHVADELGLAFALFRRRHAVGADIDDDRAGTHPIAAHHFRAAHGGDENVGAAADHFEIAGFRVGDGDAGVLLEERAALLACRPE